MSEAVVSCSKCSLPIHPSAPRRYFGHYIAHLESDCTALLRRRLTEIEQGLNAPELHQFRDGVARQAARQRERRESAPDAVVESPKFSRRQRQILRGVMRGQMDKEIARELGLTHQTLKAYMVPIRRKIGSRTRVSTALWIFARQHLLADPVDISTPEGAD